MDIFNDIKNFDIEKELDFAFLDSGHDIEILTAEIEFVLRNNISVIAFDDYSLPQVDEMIKKFLTDNTNYQLVDVFNGISGSGMGDVKIVKRNFQMDVVFPVKIYIDKLGHFIFKRSMISNDMFIWEIQHRVMN